MRNAFPFKMVGLAAAVAVASGLPAPAAFAQEGALEEIVVTGSRIMRRDLEGVGPVQVFDREDILRSGDITLGDLVRNSPAVAGAGQTTQVNNGGDGSKTISLRGLGSSRTLVLLNGRRLPDSTLSLSGVVDMNTIPIGMVERVEVLKDGASAIYGSDAVAGVINVITRRDFSGLELNAGYRETSEGDGETQEFSLTFGENFDGGYFMFDASYYDEQETSVAKRDWANVPLDFFLGDYQFLGSSAPPWVNTFVPSLGTSVTLGPDFAGGPIVAPNGQTFKAFEFFGGDSYNFAPVNHQRQPNERWMLTFEGERRLEFLPSDLGDVRVFAEAQYIRRKSQGAFAETPLAPLVFFGFDGAPYSADNFYNPFDEELGDWRRRMVEGGPRLADRSVETKRLVLGFEGDTAGWNWDLYYQHSDATAAINNDNVYNLERVANAVGPSLRDPDTGDFVLDPEGNPQCANDTDNCVPLNIFGENSITQEMLDYIAFTTNEQQGASHNIWSVNLANSNIAELPAGPLGIAFGAQYRKEKGFDRPDSQVQSLALANAVTGVPRFGTSGSYNVKELYVELLVPLLSDAPMVQSLELDLAHRYSDYNTFGSTHNSKIGLRWRMNDDLMLRGGFSEAFRAPQIGNLFGGAGTSFPTLTDPCADNPTQFCINDGVPAAGFEQPSQQISTRVGGNPDVEPEEADIFTAGLVYTPTWLDGASLTIDYYNVELKNTISTLGGQFILNSCAESGDLCDQITRFGAGTGVEGAVSSLDNRLTNVGGVKTAGWDFGLRYQGLNTDFGTFDFRADATYIDKYDKEVAGGQVIRHGGRFIDDQDGWFGDWKVNGSVSWSWQNFGANWDIRYINSAKEQYTDLFTGEQFERSVSGRMYHDVQFNYRIEQINTSVVIGANNLFDKDPPFAYHAFNDNTDVRTFDTLGRVVYARLRYAM